ncbi:unnamed protein product [Fusarium graminearum]|uniref:Uncharacterized protein n=1 Tax=Gibberella zeae TaxID=5518 RepID=A0A4E9DLP6_GIBZA|nr:unnamed protein product [Fusarium graminearum]CAG1976390.1 unnamed protein product [Fusarium graminearum]CAG1983196.1 unnamed protein product [Fusarium graminearum]
MLMTEPPQDRYMCDSARVENCGPSRVALIVQYDAIALHMSCASLDNVGKTCIKGISEPNVSNYTALEEGERSDTLCAIDGLVRKHKVHRLDLLLQRTDGGESNNGSNANVS